MALSYITKHCQLLHVRVSVYIPFMKGVGVEQLIVLVGCQSQMPLVRVCSSCLDYYLYDDNLFCSDENLDWLSG